MGRLCVQVPQFVEGIHTNKWEAIQSSCGHSSHRPTSSEPALVATAIWKNLLRSQEQSSNMSFGLDQTTLLAGTIVSIGFIILFRHGKTIDQGKTAYFTQSSQ